MGGGGRYKSPTPFLSAWNNSEGTLRLQNTPQSCLGAPWRLNHNSTSLSAESCFLLFPSTGANSRSPSLQTSGAPPASQSKLEGKEEEKLHLVSGYVPDSCPRSHSRSQEGGRMFQCPSIWERRWGGGRRGSGFHHPSSFSPFSSLLGVQVLRLPPSFLSHYQKLISG